MTTANETFRRRILPALNGRYVLILVASVLLVFTWLKPALNDNVDSRLSAIQSIVEHHTTQIDGSPYAIRTVDKIRIRGHFYSEKPPLLAFLGAAAYYPVYAAGYSIWQDKFSYFFLVFVLLGGSFLVCLACFHNLVRRAGVTETAASAMTLMLGLGTLCLPFATTLNNHSFAASWLFVGVYGLVRAQDDPSLRWMRVAGWSFGVAFGADYSVALIIAALGVYMLLEPALRGRLLSVALPCAVVLAFSLGYNYWVSGSFKFIQTNPEYFVYPGSYFGLGREALTGVERNSIGYAASYGAKMLLGLNGFLLYCPLLLFAIGGAIVTIARRRPFWKLAVAVLAGCAAFVGYYAFYSTNWSGCSFSIRWFVAFIPILWFFATPLFAESSKRTRIALGSVFAASIVIAVIGYVNPWGCGWPVLIANLHKLNRLKPLIPVYVAAVFAALVYADSVIRKPGGPSVAVPSSGHEEWKPSSPDRNLRHWLIGILLVAFALRLGIAIAFPTSDFPDEIFQTREQAHRLVYGYGTIPWEFREGIRSWVFPGLLSVIIRATAWLGAGSTGYTFGINFVLCALSLTAVWVAFRWGYRDGGLPPAILAGTSCAVWYGLVYYAPQALTEAIAAYMLLPGLYLGYFADTRADADDRSAFSPGTGEAGLRSPTTRLILSGLFLGLSVAFRIQLAPAVVVAAIWICRWNSRKWLALGGGLAFALLCFGFVDAFTWGYPFASYWNSITINVLHHKSNMYGKEPAGWYLEQFVTRFGAAIFLAILGARRSWFLSSIAGAILLTHLAFPHKEYRFIVPMIPILCILMGLGLASSARMPSGGYSRPRVAAALAVIILISAVWAARNDVWHRNAGQILAAREISMRGDVCGVGMAQWVFLSGGYFYIHQDVPIYLIAEEFPHDYSSFNYLISPEGYDTAYPPEFRVQACRSGYCLYERPGPCTAPPKGYSINRLIQQLNM
jgi:hypothetical protein